MSEAEDNLVGCHVKLKSLYIIMSDEKESECDDLFWDHPNHTEYMSKCSACYAEAHPNAPVKEEEFDSDWEDEAMDDLLDE